MKSLALFAGVGNNKSDRRNPYIYRRANLSSPGFSVEVRKKTRNQRHNLTLCAERFAFPGNNQCNHEATGSAVQYGASVAFSVFENQPMPNPPRTQELKDEQRSTARTHRAAKVKAIVRDLRRFDFDKRFIASETGTVYTQESAGDWTYHHPQPKTYDVTNGRLPFFDPAGSLTNPTGRGQLVTETAVRTAR